MFVDRVAELAALRSRLASESFEFVVVYGRRRLGKTTLLYEVTKNADALYYLCSKSGNLRKFKEAAGLAHLSDDWEGLFRALKDRVIVLDEFPYLLEDAPAVAVDLQNVVDLHFKHSRTKLILCGSIVSVLKENLLEYNAPLYGRKTAQMKIRPIRFLDSAGFYAHAGFEDLLKAYSFSGGVPQYAASVRFPFEPWFEKEVVREDSFLADEVEFLIKSEFKKEKTYFLILDALSAGKNTFGEIKEYGKFRETDITPYLKNLRYAELIDAEKPLFGAKKNSRYLLRDGFTRFWFNFIYPRALEIDVRKYSLDRGAFNRFLGRAFEDVVRQLLAESAFASFLGISPGKIGRQWGRIPKEFKPEKGFDQYEIDAVAVDEKAKRILFAECKWQDRADARKLAEELSRKAQYVKQQAGGRRETLAIFAKSFKRKITEFDGKPVLCLDLKDFDKLLKPPVRR